MPKPFNPASPPDRHGPTDIGATVLAAVLSAVSDSPAKLTLVDLQKQLATTHALKRKQVQSAVHRLATDGDLVFTQEHGLTFIRVSFNRPVRISERIILAPAGRTTALGSDDAVVFLQPGGSFGDGRHPTTRLAVRGIEYVATRLVSGAAAAAGGVLDIGTGTGVLIMAAVRLGYHGGIGLDIDVCALTEAKANVRDNNLQTRIQITDRPLDDIDGRFAMVTANLRPPTLKQLRFQIGRLLEPSGALIITGARTTEFEQIAVWYRAVGYEVRWSASEEGWGAAVFQKEPGSG